MASSSRAVQDLIQKAFSSDGALGKGLQILKDLPLDSPVVQSSGFFLASLLTMQFLQWRSKIHLQNAYIREPCRPKEVTWLDDTAFSVLVAICDAILPRIAANDIDSKDILEAFESMCPGIKDLHIISPEEVEKHKAHFVRGALDMNVAEFTALAFQGALLPDDKQKLSMFLKVLSTTPGTLLLFGYAAPFQVCACPS